LKGRGLDVLDQKALRRSQDHCGRFISTLGLVLEA
jgi:hypothetical protein